MVIENIKTAVIKDSPSIEKSSSKYEAANSPIAFASIANVSCAKSLNIVDPTPEPQEELAGLVLIVYQAPAGIVRLKSQADSQ